MTESQFRAMYSKPDGFKRVLNYSVCSVLLVMGLWFAFMIATSPFPSIWARLGAMLIPMMCIAPAVYGFWRIPRDHIVWELKTGSDKSETHELLQEFLRENRFKVDSSEGSFMRAYRERWWQGVNLSVFVMEDRLLYNIGLHQEDGPYGQGWFDHGVVERLRKRLVHKMGSMA